MKRLVVIAIMAAFLLGTVGAAQAIQFQAKGDWQMSANYVKNPGFDSDVKDDPFQAVQRVRTTFEFIANENLKGVVRFNTGDVRWGARSDRAGGLDVGNRFNWDFDRAYLDFMIPNSPVNIKAGLQPITLPNNLGSFILDDNVWGVFGSTQFNDMVGVTVGWARLADDETSGPAAGDPGRYSKDEIDMLALIVPVSLDGVQLNPFGAVAFAGKNAFNQVGGNADPTSSTHYWVGLSASMDMFDPITVMADFNFGGNSHFGENAAEQNIGKAKGWIANLAVAYNMDMFTPMIYGLYESGESRTSTDAGNTSRVMPTLSGDLWGFSTFGFSGSQFRGNGRARLGQANASAFGPSGKWGVGFKLVDIAFIDKLTHEFQAGYYQGTNHKDNLGLFTTADKAWEVNFNSQYQMYENLAAILELGYMAVDMSARGTDWRGDLADDAAWKAAAGFRYRF
ncbi:outer membrane homotrimeric porin [Desulfonatronovibrio magnus]|uniref:outer membrane homotrimeric porin n=1 Tax=Desulfonatronovibrio magnus TaxID=698827 RepID=UPI0005EAFE50|nr:outer membrane homotrimeric porin [Desulfonatronovibrio magnus]